MVSSSRTANDGPDGAEVIAWAAAQEWCIGDVATWGASYGGRVQWLTALERPPALRAMVCLVTPSDPFVEHPTGVPTPMQHRTLDEWWEPVRYQHRISEVDVPVLHISAGMTTRRSARRPTSRSWSLPGGHTPSRPSRLILN